MRRLISTMGATPGCSAHEASRRNPGHREALRVLFVLGVLLGAWSPSVWSAEDAPLARPGIAVSDADGSTQLEAPAGIAIDPVNGEVLVANSGQHRVDVFDMDGYPLGHFTHRVRDAAGEWIAGSPYELAIDARGHVFLVDRLAPYVDVLDYRGNSLQQIVLPEPDHDLEAGGGAGALALRVNGNLLVGTRGKQGRIHEFDSEFELLRSWGVPGSEPGQLAGISGLSETPGGDVVVVCSQTELVVQIFRADGKYVRGFGIHDIGEGNFSLPSGVVTTADGRIWVSDELRQVVQVFDTAGNFLGRVGSGGRAPGEFLYPSALASDGRGLIAVTERVGNRYQLLRVP